MRKGQQKSKALYVHIPFCTHLCHYCDFTKLLYNDTYAQRYIIALLKEIECLAIPKKSLSSIYIGGGTPSALNNGCLKALLNSLQPYLTANYEFTVETNIEDFTNEKGELFRLFGVNRLSFGVQSFDNKVLAASGRLHNRENVFSKIALAKSLGFINFNIDLIYGLPSQAFDIYKSDLELAVSLDVPHISTYSLTVSPNTVFYNNRVECLPEEIDRMFYDWTVFYLKKQGYERYEVSNFAKNKSYSKHNLTYWRNESYYGVGLGAHGYIDNIRYSNTKNLNKYLSGQYRAQEEIVSDIDLLEYEFILRLRTNEGIIHDDFYAKFKKKVTEDYKDVYNDLCRIHLLEDDGTRIRVTDEGMAILDTVILKFIRKVI